MDEYLVSGDITPDVTGVYEFLVSYSGKPAYQKVGGGAYLYWWGSELQYNLAVTIGSANKWIGQDGTLEGEYTPAGTNTGTPTVSLIESSSQTTLLSSSSASSLSSSSSTSSLDSRRTLWSAASSVYLDGAQAASVEV